MEKNKNSYTYLEMLLALREHYQGLQTALDEMKDRTHIDSKIPYKADLWLNSQDEWRDPELYPTRVQLSIRKDVKHSKWYEARLVHGSVKDLKEHTYFILNEQNGMPYYEQAEENPYYVPAVIIPNQDNEEFKKYYDQVKQSFFYTATTFTRQLNPFQSLDIETFFMALRNSGYGGDMTISYDPKDDLLHFKGGKDYYPDLARRVLETKIPKYEVREEYHPILDSFEREFDLIEFEDGIKKDDVMAMTLEPGCLVLNRVPKKN